MNSDAFVSKTVLFPNYFKKVGVAIIVLSLATPITLKILELKPSEEDFNVLKPMVTALIFLGLFFLVSAKEKEENEFVESCRSKAMRFSFTYGIVYVIGSPFIHYLFEGNLLYEVSAAQVIGTMVMVYLMLFSLLKYLK